MCITRLNPNAILCMPKLVIEEENEIKKDVVQKEEELETIQEIVVENILKKEHGWKVSSKKIQRRYSFPSTLMNINEIANQYDVLSEHEEENAIKINDTISQTK